MLPGSDERVCSNCMNILAKKTTLPLVAFATFMTIFWVMTVATSSLLAQTVEIEHADDAATTAESDAPADDTYIHLRREKNDQPVEMRVAIVRFVPKSGQPDGLYVDLVSAIHVADKAYYEDLNRRFRNYDAVLYELVAPEGTRVPKGGVERNSPVSWLQGSMTKVLGLSFQLDEVDYTAKNFVHADMSPEEFAQSMKDRGETMISILAQNLRTGICPASKRD